VDGVPPVRLRLSERDARTVLLIQAIEDADADGVLLPPRARASATRRVFDEDARPTDDWSRLPARAALLRDEVVRAAPALQRVLEPPRPRTTVIVLTVAVAAIIGAATNAWGPARHVSVLAFPLAGILAWNIAVYAALAARAVAHAVTRVRGVGRERHSTFLGRWLHDAWVASVARRLGASARSAAVTDAIQRFQRLWLATAASLVGARLRVVLHLGALAMALGAVAGMYVSGIAFEYRATWESTWLDASAVQRYVDIVLGSAARVLGIPVPDVAPLRGPGGDGHAAPWIHLWGTTVALFVVIPRAALAIVDALTAARLSRRLPIEIDGDYARRALQSGRGAATLVEIVYYSCAPEQRLRERLVASLQDYAGARAMIRDAAHLAYGDPPERVTLPERPTGGGLVALVFTLAQTPEPEVHGEFVEQLRERVERAGWRLVLVLETATYRQRVGSEARVRERRATWERLLRDLHLTALDVA